jgi:hypothetical protein
VKAIVTIGYVSLLFPDVAKATKALELLSGSVAVDDRLYDGKLCLEARAFRLEMKVVPEGTTYLRKRHERDEEGEPIEAAGKSVKTLGGTRQLRLCS